MSFLTSMIDWPGPLPEDSWGFLASSILGLLSNLSGQSVTFLRVVSISLHALNAFLFFLVARDALAPSSERHTETSSYLAAGAAFIFAVYPLAPDAVSWLGGMAYEIGTAFWLFAFYLYIKGKREHDWTTLGVAWISFLLAVLSDNSLWSSGFIIVALELAKSFIGPHQFDENAEVASEDEVFEDAVDRMMEDSLRGHGYHIKEDGTPAPIETTVSQAANERTETNNIETNAIGNSSGAKDDDAETEEGHSDGADELFNTLTPTLPFIVLGVVISIRTLPERGNEQLPGDMIAGFSDWARVLKALFIPISESLGSIAPTAFWILLAVYAALLVVSLGALAKNKQFRQNAAFLFAWLIMIVVPHLHTTLIDGTFSGARLAYSAMLPTTALIALCAFAPVYWIITSELNHDDSEVPQPSPAPHRRHPLIFVSLALVTMLIIGGLAGTVNQNLAYKSGAEKLERIFSTSQEIAKEPNAAMTIIRDMPADIAVGEQITPDRTILLYTRKPLIRAPHIPDGRLKDAFRDGKYHDIALRWKADENKLVRVDLDVPLTSDIKFDSLEIKRRSQRSSDKSESTTVEERNGELVLSSISSGQPCLEIDASGFSPLGDNFLYIDCKIDTKGQEEESQIKLQWLTDLKNEYDKERRSYAKVIANDKQFHRYFIPIRSTAWSTNGDIKQLKFLFPESSTVSIRDIGTSSSEERLPLLSFIGTSKTAQATDEPRKERIFSALTFDYPNHPSLGLVSFDKKSEVLNLHYDASKIPGVQDCVAEISRVNQFFDLPNADDFAAKSLKTIHLDKPAGDFKLAEKDFKIDGIYSIRVFAVNKEGKLLANSSDAIDCLIYTRPRRN